MATLAPPIRYRVPAGTIRPLETLTFAHDPTGRLDGPLASRRSGPKGRTGAVPAARKRGVPEGVWMRCDGCGATVFRKVEQALQNVCPECQHHFPLPAATDRPTARHRHLRGMVRRPRPGDPLGFNDRRPYPERVEGRAGGTGLNEAAVVGQGFIKGIRVVFGLTDSRFIMGTMGSVVGEKLTRAIEEATRPGAPAVIVSGSGGGARMHEGIFSLMQMAKVSAALGRYHAAGGLFISAS